MNAPIVKSKERILPMSDRNLDELLEIVDAAEKLRRYTCPSCGRRCQGFETDEEWEQIWESLKCESFTKRACSCSDAEMERCGWLPPVREVRLDPPTARSLITELKGQRWKLAQKIQINEHLDEEIALLTETVERQAREIERLKVRHEGFAKETEEHNAYLRSRRG